MTPDDRIEKQIEAEKRLLALQQERYNSTERLSKLEDEHNKTTLEYQAEIIRSYEALRAASSDPAEQERLRQSIAGLEAQRDALTASEDRLKSARDAAADYGKVFGDSLVSISDGLLQNAAQIQEVQGGLGGLRSLATAAGDAMGGFAKKMEDLNILFVVLDKTKDLVFQLDGLGAEFVKATGASREMAEEAFQLRGQLMSVGVSGAAAVGSMSDLLVTFKDFTQLSKSQREEFTLLASQLDKLGFSSAGVAEVLTNVVDMPPGRTLETMRDLAGTAIALGVPMSELSSDLVGNAELFAKLGDKGMDVFKGLAAAAKETGLQVSQLYSIASNFDSFEGAAEAAGRLNVVLGGNLIDTYTLLSATEEERIALLQRTLQASGKTWESMSRFERIELSRAMNIGLEESARLFSSTSQEVERTAAQIMHASMTEEELAQRTRDAATAMEKLQVFVENLAVAVTPLVHGLNMMVDLWLKAHTAITKLFGGGNNAGIGAAITMFGLLKGAIWGLKKIWKGFSFDFSNILPTRAPGGGGGPAGTISKIGEAATKSAKGILALGAAFLMIGAGVGLAALGMAEFVKAFKGFEAGQILAISVALGVFGATMVFLLSTLGSIVASGIGVAAVGAILALGASFVMIGFGVKLAAEGIGTLIESFRKFGPTQILAIGGSLLMLSVALSSFVGAVTILGLSLLNPLFTAGLVAFAAFILSFNRLDETKISSLATVLNSLENLDQIIENASLASEAIRQIIDTIEGIDDVEKFIVFSSVTNGLTEMLEQIKDADLDKVRSVIELIEPRADGTDVGANALELIEPRGEGTDVGASARERWSAERARLARLAAAPIAAMGRAVTSTRGDTIVIELDGKKLGQWMDRREDQVMKRVALFK